MIGKLIAKIRFGIARLSKKGSAIFISLLSLFFLISLGVLLSGVILLTSPNPVSLAGILRTGIGGIVVFLTLAAVALTSISSNYVRKNPDKNPENEDQDIQ